MRYRLLRTGPQTGAMNMAIDESVLKHVSEGRVAPTLRFYGWKPSAVTIGYFQSMKEEVDIEKCKKLGVDFIRRMTGGGAVYHENEVTYSLITHENLFSPIIQESYKQICGGIIKGLNKLGLVATFEGLNDIIVHNKKISGNAQTRKNYCILQHGTVLMGVDPEKMFSLLLVPDEKIKDKMIKSVSERLTCLKKEIDRNLTNEEVTNFLVDGFQEVLSTKFEFESLSLSELELAQKLFYEKYSTSDWNFKR